jgi:hypothetical protein
VGGCGGGDARRGVGRGGEGPDGCRGDRVSTPFVTKHNAPLTINISGA